MFQAKDIMTKEVIRVHKDTPISEAIQIMVDNNITGVPVVEEDMTLVGILSEMDVLRLFHTHEQERNRTAGEFMTQPAVYFEESERLLDVCYRLRDYPIRRVPVTSDGKVTGIISRADILKCTLQLLQEPCHASSED
ncbi:HPP family protein [Planctomycetota bacterium]